MSISVVTVVLNDGAGLPLTIESVRQQDFSDVELIVVDGGSQDSTADVLQLYRDSIDKLVHLQDAGIYHAMNAALDYCSKEYVLFLNSNDTLFASSTLRDMIGCKRSDADIFFGNHIYVRDDKEYFKRAVAYEESMLSLFEGNVDHLWLSQLPGHQATFVRLDLLRRLRFNTRISICADHDLMVRAYNSGATFQFIDEIVAHYSAGGFSARSPKKLALEWCSLYREQSKDPQAVDRFFLGDTISPFGPQNAVKGHWIAGNYPLEAAQPSHGIQKPITWCRPRITLRSPARFQCGRIMLEGYNPFDWQHLVFFLDGCAVGEMKLDGGWFKRKIEFDVRLSFSAIIEVTAARLGSVPQTANQPIVLALASFAFETIDAHAQPMTPGDNVPFTKRNAAQASQMLGYGWSSLETGWIWTIGEIASLDLHVSPAVSAVVMRCRGNPFIQAAETRGFDLFLNGKMVGRYLLAVDEETEIEVDVSSLDSSFLTLALRPLLRLEPPQDGRPLGVALSALAFRSRVALPVLQRDLIQSTDI